MKRSCDGCTVCCDGNLSAEILGHKMYPGKPCFFRSQNKCSIYHSRPKDPCVDFECEWLRREYIPENMKPNLSGVVLAHRVLNGYECVEMIHSGLTPINESNIKWFVNLYNNGLYNNIYYRRDLFEPATTGGIEVCAFGSDGFLLELKTFLNL